jgi:hypothetical protein
MTRGGLARMFGGRGKGFVHTATKEAGRNIMPRAAIVFIATLSFLESLAMDMLVRLSYCLMELST